MILGQTANRMSDFTRPQDANFYNPTLMKTAFYSHFTPFRQHLLPMASFRPNLPGLPGRMRPVPTQQSFAPGVPSAPTMLKGFGHAPGVSPFAFMDTDPSRTMRSGAWMSVTPGGVRQGVTQSGQFLTRQMTGYGPGFRPAGPF